MLGKTSVSDLSEHVFDLILELYNIDSHLLLSVLPQLEFKLKVKKNTLSVKGDRSFNMHFLMSFIHKYVSPVCQGTHAASVNKTLSLFLRTQISKNGATTELIQICVRYDVISEM